MDKFIIGFVGSFGCGCSYIAESFFNEYKYISLSDILRDEYKQAYPDECSESIPRTKLQDFGNMVRKQKITYLADRAIEIISNDNSNTKFVIDSIRNPEEIYAMKDKFVNFYVFGIYADKETRWDRILGVYDNDKRLFEKDEARDKGEKILNGQRVTDCFLLSDVIISNNEPIRGINDAYNNLKSKIIKYIGYLSDKTGDKIPTEIEANMAMAYADSLRSSCLKRKVGAVIVDKVGNSFSSGYNEMPRNELPCKSLYGECFRNYRKREIGGLFNKDNEELKEKVLGKIKILDQCRALHAEENAIINVAKFGSSSALSESTLYTTTYPCNLCANKIAQVNIKKVVYFEPYPVEAAKKTLLEAGVEQVMFEGITYNSFFKVFSSIIF